MIAGGASFAPRRWSLLAEATTARSRPWYLCTARITAAQNTRNCAFSCGVSPGSSRLPCEELPSDQFTCLPEPLTPANGFSCIRQAMPYFSATLRIMIIVICWWSVARLADSNTGAISYWLGATSLWRVLTGMPSLIELALQIEHERQHAVGDGSEIVIVELLALGRLGSEQGPPGIEQIGPREEEVAVDQEVLLLGAGGRRNQRPVGVAEQLQHALRLLVQRLRRAQHRGLFVKRLAGPGNERRRDT